MDSQQNKIAYITGTSRGIGRAIAELLLQEGYMVYGIGRTNEIQHHHFFPINLDLSDLKAVEAFFFDAVGREVILINNAGIIGEIGPIGVIANHTIQSVMTVNALAPQMLINKFIDTYRKQDIIKGQIINISSGAGKYPIDGWANYCASKAAIDIYSETIDLEFKLHQLHNWHIHSIAPGVVDTGMQSEIRSSNPELFKSHQKFIDLKADNELNKPENVATKLYEVIADPKRFDQTIISVRDF
ncbi:SDR family NAD(P)-dependent oxidoreductase [Crocinitomix algicola]|uniref:SDR family NAD(P)-dependent oxidoreductase n=1 Tax=Crocinitomix algicola TaxID=1740263 RepID=UPI00083363AD|nr:SDR family NAD(P)-dependent oxidoreductase [Crocinitomix algicola]